MVNRQFASRMSDFGEDNDFEYDISSPIARPSRRRKRDSDDDEEDIKTKKRKITEQGLKFSKKECGMGENKTNHPIIDVNWNEYDEEPTPQPNYCFLCEQTQCLSEANANPNYITLKRFINENYASMDPGRLCRQAQTLYNTLLRPFDQRKRNLPWHCKTIWQHIDEHTYNPSICEEDAFRTMNVCLRTIRDGGLITSTPSEDGGPPLLEVDKDKSLMWLAFYKERKQLMKEIKARRPTTVL
jgi:hypothetical protein